MSTSEVMIAYYEAYPNEAPSQTATVSQTNKPENESVKEAKVNRSLTRKDCLLAVGFAAAVTILVVVVLGVLS